jgi:hypothetical protein
MDNIDITNYMDLVIPFNILEDLVIIYKVNNNQLANYLARSIKEKEIQKTITLVDLDNHGYDMFLLDRALGNVSLFNNLNLILEYKLRLHLYHSPLLIKQTFLSKLAPTLFNSMRCGLITRISSKLLKISSRINYTPFLGELSIILYWYVCYFYIFKC